MTDESDQLVTAALERYLQLAVERISATAVAVALIPVPPTVEAIARIARVLRATNGRLRQRTRGQHP